ncbi:MAG: site-specific DNA-methyltransferase [Deltaproteobacteria bacterium]|uniref:Methyltransferase n=1 Tax=Candidatus Zymogenus saltonus TaxID=2844893 RepID=A0A9D8PNP8_9DELT|nr:site-specific DNA-methyltransferase [Candidatus Zymogenus saltonus]
MKNQYKKIELELRRELNGKELSILKDLSVRIPEEDFFIEQANGNIVLNLRALDLNSFESMVKELSTRYHLQEDDNPFLKIRDKILAIGSYGIKGKKRLFVGYNKERKVKDRTKKGEERGLHYYAMDGNFKKRNNELPDEYVNRIICDDSEEFLKQLPENSIDLVFTSPPYNFGLDYDSDESEDGVDWQKYFDKLFAVFDECIRVLKYGGRIIVNIQPLFSDYIPSHHVISNFFMQKKLIWKGEILWEKNNYNCKYTAWGSWKSPSSPYLKYTWEFLEVFCKGTLKKEGKTENIDITGDEFKKWVVSKWSIAPERNMKKYDHPAMFPEELAIRVLKLFSFKNDIVLDPFNGVGTTTAVARKLQRRYLGIDISEEYCQRAQDRIGETLF